MLKLQNSHTSHAAMEKDIAVPSPSTAATEVVGLDRLVWFATENDFELTQTEVTFF